MKAEHVLETTGQDWANHLSHEVSGNGTVCFAALLSGKPDAEILRQAAADLVASQPVLGCRFDDKQDPPVWIPTGDADWFTQMDTESLSEGLDVLLQEPSARSRQMEVRLISTPSQEALCIRLNHAATDGGGAKRCFELLNRYYNLRLAGSTTPERMPQDRSDRQVFERCGLPDYRSALRRETPGADPIATVPYVGMDGRKVQYRWTSMPLSAVRRPGVTVNDRLLYAYALALSDTISGEAPIEIHMTVDLRRYLETVSAPITCNLSGMETVRVTVSPKESSVWSLADVHRQTTLMKSNHAGLSSAAMMACLRTLPYEKARALLLSEGRKSRHMGTAAPILSNLGLICPDAMHFGNAEVLNILPLLPAMHAPAFLLGAGSYEDALTLSAGFYAEERATAEVERLLQKIRDIAMTM